jgi:uridine kinase
VNLDWQVRPLDDLVHQIRVRTTARPAMIAVNGHSSSGKTTLARRLTAALDCSDVLHTDDIAWHQGVFAWDALLINDVLPVVRSGRPLRYRPPAWKQRRREGSVELAGELDFLIIEGVGASQPSVRHELDVVIWVETDEPTRAARDARRIDAGETAPSGYLRWMAEENAYVAQHQPWLDADFLIEGGDSIDHDRNAEVVLAGRS